MVLIETNKAKRLLHITYAGHVTKEDLRARRGEVQKAMEEFPNGFRWLTDLTQLTSMDRDCREDITAMMELAEAKGVEMVVRVIPDPSKDIGLSIMSLFHYKKMHPITCETLKDAAKILGI